MWQMKRCCWCFSVRTGTLIIGILSMVSSIISLIWFISRVASSQQAQQHSTLETHDENLLYFWVINASAFTCILVAIWSCVCMIYGVLRKSSKHIYPWLALIFSGTLLETFTSLAITIVVVSILPKVLWLVVVIIAALQIALTTYFWLVVHQHYEDLRAEKYNVAI